MITAVLFGVQLSSALDWKINTIRDTISVTRLYAQWQTLWQGAVCYEPD